MNASQTQQVQTVTNKLSGEKSYMDVRFAITGVAQADLLAGIFAVISSLGEQIDPFILATIFEALSKQQFEQDRRNKEGTNQYRVTQPVPSPFTNPPPVSTWDGSPLKTFREVPTKKSPR